MKRKLFVSIAFSFFIISILACAGSPLRTQWEAERNRSNMLQLKIGMSKEKVLALMGNPYKTESYQAEDKTLEFWLYLTEGINSTLKDSNFTPFAFENNILTGWGRNYYDNVLRIKQDIKIEKQ